MHVASAVGAGGRPADYLIRVNRQPSAPDYVLQEGDRVSITPPDGYSCESSAPPKYTPLI